MTEENFEITLPVQVEQIQRLLPHRYPFLLVDRVIEVVPDVSAVALKNVTINEPFFDGHFPGHPVMPGVLIIEAMAQTAAVLVVHTLGPESEGKLVYFMSVDNARFSAPVVPGDQLRLEVNLKRLVRGMGLFAARTTVDGKDVASCELMCAARS